MSLSAAIRDLESTDLDDRGLVPLDRARAIVAGATAVTRDNLDTVWAALCSLADGAELATAAAHLDWQMPPRGKTNVAFVERYGAGALAWLRTRVGHGVLTNHPWCVLPCVHALDDGAALELLLEVDGVVADGGSMVAWVFERAPVPDDRAALAAAALGEVLAWTRRHPDAAYPVLARRATDGHPRAIAALRALAERAPSEVSARLDACGAGGLVATLGLATSLSVDAVLAELDAASRSSWPTFHTGVDGRLEYFGQRLIGVRAPTGDGWAIVIERLQGCDPDMFQLARYAYGPFTTNGLDFDAFESVTLDLECDAEDAPVFRGATMTGAGGALRVDEELFARHDLRPGWHTEFGGWAARTVAIRAYLERHDAAVWPSLDGALAAAGVPGGEAIVVSRAYQHPSTRGADGEAMPWTISIGASPVMRSLVDALLARDPGRFEPGPSNLDWRLHALCEERFTPWADARVEGVGAVAAAMAEAGVTVDERGLMPLAEARAIVAATPSLARGEGRRVGDVWVWDHDRVWAALVSLADADEAATVFAGLDLATGPRGAATNTALAERYGDGALAVVAARKDAAGVIAAASPFLRATVLAVGSAAGFGFVWDLGGWTEPGADGTPDAQAGALFAAWVAAHPAVGFVELGRLAAAGDAAALSFLQTWGAPQARKVFGWLRAALGEPEARALFARAGLLADLAAVHVTTVLDYWAAQGGDAWPRFCTNGGPPREYHALRLIGARARGGDDWVVVFERFEGYGRTLRVQRYAYADDLPSGLCAGAKVELAELAGELAELETFDEADTVLCEAPDYWTARDGAPVRIAKIRTLLPDGVPWPDAAASVAAVGRADAEVIVVATAFAHTEGPGADGIAPSQSPTFASLAAALVARSAAGFEPGVSNLSPRDHAAPVEEEEESEEDESEDDDETEEDASEDDSDEDESEDDDESAEDE